MPAAKEVRAIPRATTKQRLLRFPCCRDASRHRGIDRSPSKITTLDDATRRIDRITPVQLQPSRLPRQEHVARRKGGRTTWACHNITSCHYIALFIPFDRATLQSYHSSSFRHPFQSCWPYTVISLVMLRADSNIHC